NEASTGGKKAAASTALQAAKEADGLLPGAVSRLNTFIPQRIVQIEQLYRELLAQTEARHRVEIEKISDHLAKTEAQHKAQVEELMAGHQTEVKEFNAVLAQAEKRHKAQ